MTEEEIAALAQKWADPPQYDTYDGNEEWMADYGRLADEASEDIAALIAQVRRLRDALVPLVAEAPTYATEVGHVYCAYCHRRLTPDGFQFPDRRPYPPGHESDCPWLAARVALTRPVPAP